MDSTVGTSVIDFRFSLARLMIGKFSNRKRDAPVNWSSKKSKGKSFDTVGQFLSFLLLVLVALSSHPKRLRIVYLFTVCPAISHYISRKKEIVFIYITINNKHKHLYIRIYIYIHIISWLIYSMIIVTRLFGTLLNNNTDFCFLIKNKISNFTISLLEESEYWKDIFYIYRNLLIFSTIIHLKKSI